MKPEHAAVDVLKREFKRLNELTGKEPRGLLIDFDDKLNNVFDIPLFDECIHPSLANEIALELLAQEIHDYLIKKQAWAELKESLSPYDFRKLKEADKTLKEPRKVRIRALLTMLYNGQTPRKVELLINQI